MSAIATGTGDGIAGAHLVGCVVLTDLGQVLVECVFVYRCLSHVDDMQWFTMLSESESAMPLQAVMK